MLKRNGMRKQLAWVGLAGLAWSCMGAAEVRLLTGTAAGGAFFPEVSQGPAAASANGRYLMTVTTHIVDLSTESYEAGGVRPDGQTYEGSAAGGVSDDGRYITWVERRYGPEVYLRDLQAGTTVNITAGADGGSDYPEISADGRYVKFVTAARNLASDPSLLPPAGQIAVCVYDRETQQTRVVSLSHDGKALDKGIAQVGESSLSADGRYVFFSTAATNTHPDRAAAAAQSFAWVYRRNLETGVVDIVNRNAAGEIPSANCSTPRPSADGNRVAFACGNLGLLGGPAFVDGYTNIFGTDIYLKDMTTAAVYRISQTTTGAAPDGALTNHVVGGNGSWVAFQSSAKNHTAEETDPAGTGGGSGSFDAFRADVDAGGKVTVNWLTKAPGDPYNIVSNWLVAPANGDYVAIDSYAWSVLLGLGGGNNINRQTVGIGTFNFGGAPGIWSGAEDLGDGWWQLGWLGFFRITGEDPAQLYHFSLGWLYAAGSQDVLWVYLQDLGWVYTGKSLYPFLYRASDGAWLYYFKDTSNPRWFYNYSTGSWLTL